MRREYPRLSMKKSVSFKIIALPSPLSLVRFSRVVLTPVDDPHVG